MSNYTAVPCQLKITSAAERQASPVSTEGSYKEVRIPSTVWTNSTSSSRCEGFLKRVSCFYRCSPDAARWPHPHHRSSIWAVPLCHSFCRDWWEKREGNVSIRERRLRVDMWGLFLKEKKKADNAFLLSIREQGTGKKCIQIIWMWYEKDFGVLHSRDNVSEFAMTKCEPALVFTTWNTNTESVFYEFALSNRCNFQMFIFEWDESTFFSN